MDTSDGLRVGGNEFGFATFLEDGVHAFDFHRFKRIGGSGIAHSVMDGDEVADIGDDEQRRAERRRLLFAMGRMRFMKI